VSQIRHPPTGDAETEFDCMPLLVETFTRALSFYYTYCWWTWAQTVVDYAL